MIAPWKIFMGLLALTLVPMQQDAKAEENQRRLFVSILPQKFFVEKIASPEFEVEALVGPGQSPATFDPSPRKMSRLAEAKALLPIGVPFETAWLPKIRKGMPDLLILEVSAPPGHRHVHGDEGELDPHFWTSPIESIEMALRIRDALVRLAPEHTVVFMQRCEALIGEIEALDVDITELFANSERQRFMVFHPAWGHFAEHYGLTQIAIEREGKEPGARALAASVELAKDLGIETIFIQEQFSRDGALAVARAAGAKLVSLDPLAENYLVNLRVSAIAIEEALR